MTEKKEINFESLSLNEDYGFRLYHINNLISSDFKLFLPDLPKFLKIIEEELRIPIETDKLSLIDPDTIDLIDNIYIQDAVMLKAILTFLGSINRNNDFTQFTADINSNLEESVYLEKSNF
jgi:hypothetical protein